MLNPAVAQKLQLIALCVVGLLLAVFLGTQIGESKYGPLLLGTVIVVVASVSLFSGRFFWVLTIASSFLDGTFPILRGSFTPFQILMAIGVAKFLIGDVVLRRTRIRTPARFDTLLIAGFMAVLTWHGVHDRFGMRFLGSSIWGGRNYLNVFVGLAAFFVIMSIPMKPKLWARLPYVVIAVSLFDLTIAVITKIVPSSVYVIYPFYSAVSTGSLEQIVMGTTDITGRVGAFGNFGLILITLVLASISLPQILHPSNFFRLIALIVGSISVLYSGFRSAVFNTLTVTLAAGIRDLKFAVLALLPLVAIGLFAVSVINSEFVTLPKQVQRSLTFLPGKWDPDMVMDANASNDFRRQVWTLWLRDYFPAQPFFGRGFGFKSQWAEKSVYEYNPNSNRQAIETGNIHNGFLAALDCFGIIGTFFFVIWNFRLLVRTFKVGRPDNDPGGFTLRFIGLYLSAWIVCYWMGAATIGSFLPREFALAAVFLRLQRELTPQTIRTAVPNKLEPTPRGELTPA
jgi:hypothetical protein